MSIARTEAEKRFPIPNDVSKNQKMTLFFNQSCYIEGRTADITDAEIESAVIIAVNTLHNAYPDSMHCWEDSNEATKSRARQYAAYMLEAARKAVME